jgi:hypothetical protein
MATIAMYGMCLITPKGQENKGKGNAYKSTETVKSTEYTSLTGPQEAVAGALGRQI